MSEFTEMLNTIKSHLNKVAYDNGDLSDVGNEIGYAIGEHLQNEEDIRDFVAGLKHGASLKNGTHG